MKVRFSSCLILRPRLNPTKQVCVSVFKGKKDEAVVYFYQTPDRQNNVIVVLFGVWIPCIRVRL